MPINWAAIAAAADGPLPYRQRYGRGIVGKDATTGDPYMVDADGEGPLGDPSKFVASFDGCGTVSIVASDAANQPWLVPTTLDDTSQQLYVFKKLWAPNSGRPDPLWNLAAISKFHEIVDANLRAQKLSPNDDSRLLFMYPVNGKPYDPAGYTFDPEEHWGSDNPKAPVWNPRGMPAKAMVWYHRPGTVSIDGPRGAIPSPDPMITSSGEVPSYSGRSDWTTTGADAQARVDCSNVGTIYFIVWLPTGKGQKKPFKACGNRFLRVCYLIDLDRSGPNGLELLQDIIETIADCLSVVVGAIMGNYGAIAGGVADLVRTWATYAADWKKGQDAAAALGQVARKPKAPAKAPPVVQHTSAAYLNFDAFGPHTDAPPPPPPVPTRQPPPPPPPPPQHQSGGSGLALFLLLLGVFG